jgi:hypothetical protein
MPWPDSQQYNEAIQAPAACFQNPELRQGTAATNALGLPVPRSGNFADVYQLQGPGGEWAVKCFTREVPGLAGRYAEVSRHLRAAAGLSVLVEFTFLEPGIRVAGRWYPALKMRWVEGLTLNEFVRQYADRPAMLEALLQMWVLMGVRLREAGIAHGDLQHGNVLLVPGSTGQSVKLRLVDYDGMYVPALAGRPANEVGHPCYQHPQRLRERTYGPEVDRFPLLMVATALAAVRVGGRALWEKYDSGDNLLFREADLQSPVKSPLFYELLKLPDAQVRRLVERTLDAARAPMESVPLLDELLPELRADPAPRPAAVAPAPRVPAPASSPPSKPGTAGVGNPPSPPAQRTQWWRDQAPETRGAGTPGAAGAQGKRGRAAVRIVAGLGLAATAVLAVALLLEPSHQPPSEPAPRGPRDTNPIEVAQDTTRRVPDDEPPERITKLPTLVEPEPPEPKPPEPRPRPPTPPAEEPPERITKLPTLVEPEPPEPKPPEPRPQPPAPPEQPPEHLTKLPTLIEPEPPAPKSRQENKKPSLPDDAEVAAAVRNVREAFRDDYARAQTSKPMEALAGRLLEEARQCKDDPARRFALYREARDLAARGGALALALRVAGEMARAYPLHLREVQVAALLKARPSLDTPAGARAFVEAAMPLLKEAWAEDEYAVAEPLVALTRQALPGARDPALLAASDPFLVNMETLATQYKAVRPGVRALKDNPEDAQANQAVGAFLCFWKHDWDRGLPLLGKAGEPALAEAARKDLAQPSDPAEQAALGEAWIELAKAHPDLRGGMHRRAYHWSARALPDLGGKEKEKVEKRVVELARFFPELKSAWDHLEVPSKVPAVGDVYLRLGQGQGLLTKKPVAGPVEITVVCRTARKGPRFGIGYGPATLILWNNADKLLAAQRPADRAVGFQATLNFTRPFDFAADTWYTFGCQLTEGGMDLSVNGDPSFKDANRYNLSRAQTIKVLALEEGLEVRSFTVKSIRP